MMKKIILFMVCILTFTTMHAQKLSDLPQKEREAYLIKKAKEIYKEKKWKKFYREFGIPKIRSFKVEGECSDPTDPFYRCKDGDFYYEVFFYYDEEKEEMETEFAARVTIRDKDGKAVLIYLGSNIGVLLRNKQGEIGR
ncbi:MAG: hypothetical protein SOZ18_05325 [Phocaeicola sp.]|nr:hypothetical protein [Phocaeicola sp.]